MLLFSVKILRHTYALQSASREDVGKMSRSFLIGWQWLSAQRTPEQFNESCTKTRKKWGYHPLETAVVILTHISQNSRWYRIILVNTVHQIQDKHVQTACFFHIWIDEKKICYQGRLPWQGHHGDQAAGLAVLRLAAFLLLEMNINFNISLACIILVSHSRLLVAFPHINYWAVASRSLVCCYLKRS